ncbi:hypothetical protein GEMRC1_012114 [Eukaryota sp. GEM-RC1]
MECSSFVTALQFIEAHSYYFPSCDYLKATQVDPFFTESARRKLVHMIFELGNAYGFEPSTCVLALTYLERYLSFTPVSLSDLQLLASTCFFIASKVDESSCGFKLRLDDLAALSGQSFEPNAILTTEKTIMCALDHRLLDVTLIQIIDLLISSLPHFASKTQRQPSYTSEHPQLRPVCFILFD